MRIGKGNIHVLKLHGTLEIEFFSCAALKTEKLENRIGCPPSASVIMSIGTVSLLPFISLFSLFFN